MEILFEGRVISLLLTVFLFVALLLLIERAKKGTFPQIRRLPPLDAIDEAIRRAVEMGKPVHFTTGYGGGGLNTASGKYHLVGLTVYNKVSSLTAELDVRLIGSFCHPELVPIAEDIINKNYLMAGKPEAVKPEMAQLIGGQQFAYAMGVMGILLEERPAANIMIGNWWAESLLVAETGTIVNAMQIAGGTDVTAVPMLVAACDYVLMFEELFAAKAYLTEEPALIGSLASQDLFKYLALVFGLIGVVFATLGIDWSWFLNL